MSERGRRPAQPGAGRDAVRAWRWGPVWSPGSIAGSRHRWTGARSPRRREPGDRLAAGDGRAARGLRTRDGAGREAGRAM